MTMSERLSTVQLHELLVEAAETERRLPPAFRKTTMGCWPEYRQSWLSYPDPHTQTKLAPATARQISNYDRVLLLVAGMPAVDDRQILWSVAHSAAFRRRGPGWMKISRWLECDWRTVKRHYLAALVRLYYRQLRLT